MSIKPIAREVAAFAVLTFSACKGGQSGRVPAKDNVGAGGEVAAAVVTLSGKAQSCHPGMPIRLVGIRGVDISAFQVSKVPSLMLTLKAMDTTSTTDVTAMMMRLDTLSTRAYHLVNSSTAIARVVSDSSGTFELTIPSTDSVLVYGLGHDEDEPFNHAYTTMSGRANRSFVLDMSHGGCTP